MTNRDLIKALPAFYFVQPKGEWCTKLHSDLKKNVKNIKMLFFMHFKLVVWNFTTNLCSAAKLAALRIPYEYNTTPCFGHKKVSDNEGGIILHYM